MKDFIPHQVVDYYNPVSLIEGDTIVSEGNLSCLCSCTSFTVQHWGETRKGILGQVELIATGENGVGMSLSCQKCGTSLTLFDSETDGYDVVVRGVTSSTKNTLKKLETLSCPKCFNKQFHVKVKYEHLPKTETDVVGLLDSKNAFQWIWVSLECNSCSKKFRNFIDHETG
ncbi:MAG: hypothetical protein LBU61_00460 [Coriobacteriales bacterium]|jgi:hypothetical protein|nr:hypothetical protein [Coriobacteriales bacterium]